MNTIPNSVSIIMRSFNEAWAIGDTIEQIYNQNFLGKIDLIVIDSGSTDGSIEIIKKFERVRLIQIPLGTYVPGVVLNQGADEAKNDWIIYLNADATPVHQDWLTNLLEPCLKNPKFGAAFSRQVPRPDCMPVFAHDYDRCFGPDRESKHWDHFFSMVSCITCRSVLDKVPIREDLQYAEDDEWTRRLVANNYEILFVEDSIVMHSHNYTLRQCYKRSFGDAKAMAATSNVQPQNVNYHYFVCFGLIKDVLRDLKWSIRNGHIASIPHSIAVRLFQRLGRRAGHHSGWKYYNRPT